MSKERKKARLGLVTIPSVEQGYYSVRGIVEVRKEGERGRGSEGSQGDTEGPHARAAHRYAITWLQPDVICMRVSSLRHEAGREEKKERAKEHILSRVSTYVCSFRPADLSTLI